MMKRIILFLQIVIVCTMIYGCSKENEKENNIENNKYIKELPNQIKEDEYIVCINDMELEINSVTMMSEIPFHILSTEELSLSDIQVKLDTDVPYEVVSLKSTYNTGKFPDYICLQYNKFDWKSFKELAVSSEKDDLEDYFNIKEEIDKEYKALEEEDFPNYYDNSFVIRLDTFEKKLERHVVDEVEISVKGNTYCVDVGNIYLGIQAKNINVGEYQLSFMSGGRANYNIWQDAEGKISISGFELEVKEDAVIKDIYLLNEAKTIELSEATIDISDGVVSFNSKWEKGKDIELQKGTKAFLNLDVCDENFKGKQSYSVNIYINIEYEVDGEIYETRTQVLCGSRYDSPTLYAIYYDGINMSEYYENYYQ